MYYKRGSKFTIFSISEPKKEKIENIFSISLSLCLAIFFWLARMWTKGINSLHKAYPKNFSYCIIKQETESETKCPIEVPM